MQGEGLLDTFVILGILILNAIVGAYQERKAESSLEALKNLTAPETKVLRDGTITEIPTRELVPGDIVILETGAIIPADLRLNKAINLKIQESSLTGESVPVDKQTKALPDEDIALGDRNNMAFSSGIVTYGRGRGIVVATGMKTEVGKIADLLQQTADTETPMSRRLEQLGKVLGIAALIICAVIFLVGVLYGKSVLSMFMTAVSLAVTAIPEGLPAVSTVVLAISPLKNKPLIGAIFVSAGLALIVLLIPPVRDAFSLTELDGKHWLQVVLMSLIPILVVDIFKLLRINTTRDERTN
jgi:Ca2+-transporting ATPase